MLDDFFEDGAAPRRDAGDFQLTTIWALKEKVEKDIGVPWHRIGPAEVRQWREKGFSRAKRGEYREANTASSHARRGSASQDSCQALSLESEEPHVPSMLHYAVLYFAMSCI